jgi:hypothetical protein
MNPFDSSSVARFVIEDRIRDADHRRLVRESRRREQPFAARAASPAPRPPSRLWSLAHLGPARS